MSMRVIQNTNTMKENGTRDSVYTIHTHKYIEHLPNKPPTTTMGDRQVRECTCCHDKILKANTRIFYFEKILKAVGVRI